MIPPWKTAVQIFRSTTMPRVEYRNQYLIKARFYIFNLKINILVYRLHYSRYSTKWQKLFFYSIRPINYYSWFSEWICVNWYTHSLFLLFFFIRNSIFYYFWAFKNSFHFNTCHLSELIRAIRMTPMKRVDIRDKAPMILQAKARLELIAVIKYSYQVRDIGNLSHYQKNQVQIR